MGSTRQNIKLEKFHAFSNPFVNHPLNLSTQET